MSSQIFAPVLQTPRLTLILCEAHNPTTLDNSLTIVNDPEIIAVMGDMKIRTHGQMNRFYRSTLIHPARLPGHAAPGRDDWASWAVHLKANVPEDNAAQDAPSGARETAGVGPLVGIISIGHRSAEIPPDMGWALLPAYWRKGYATEAGREVVRYATQELGLKDLVAFPLETNIASIQTAKKLGFVDGGKIGDQEGRPHLMFVRPEMEWRPSEDMRMNLKGKWVEEEEICSCSRCEREK